MKKHNCKKCNKPYAIEGYEYCYSCNLRVQLETITKDLADALKLPINLRVKINELTEENIKFKKDNEFLLKQNEVLKERLDF